MGLTASELEAIRREINARRREELAEELAFEHRLGLRCAGCGIRLDDGYSLDCRTCTERRAGRRRYQGPSGDHVRAWYRAYKQARRAEGKDTR